MNLFRVFPRGFCLTLIILQVDNFTGFTETIRKGKKLIPCLLNPYESTKNKNSLRTKINLQGLQKLQTQII